MNRTEDQERVFGVLAVSTAAHVLVFVALGFAPSSGEAALFGSLDFEIIEPELPELEEPEPEPEPVEPEPEPEPAPEPRAAPRARAPRPAAEEPEPPEPEAPPPETPVEFPGVTLTSDTGDSSWTTVVGSGAAIRKPVVIPHKPPEKEPVEKAATGNTGGGTGRKRNRARPPQQPRNMDETLLRFYPKQARAQGIEGLAVMRVRIMPDGKVARVKLVRETYEGFGDACKKTLKSARWRPKLDERGRPMAVDISYTCRFEVAY
jgi:protein TonB